MHASSSDPPDIFFVHPEIKKMAGLVDYEKLGEKSFYGCEVETATRFTKEPYVIRTETGWLPCEDGSISGAEWKSPLILAEDEIPKKISDIIDDSNYDQRCGGHIHVLRKDWNGLSETDAWDQLVDNWAWLFFTLYPERANSSYSRFRAASSQSRDSNGQKVSSAYRYRKEKYNWLHLKAKNRFEFRVFPGVKSTERLRNRMRMLDLLMADFHTVKNPDEAFTLTMDKIAPEMRKHKSMLDFPRKSYFKLGQDLTKGCLFWPGNMVFGKKAEEPAVEVPEPKPVRVRKKKTVKKEEPPQLNEPFPPTPNGAYRGCDCQACRWARLDYRAIPSPALVN